MQDIVIFVLVGIALISGAVLLFDVRSLSLPRLGRLTGIRFPPLSSRLPFLARPRDEDLEEYEDYRTYLAPEPDDDDAGSFAPSRSPFSTPAMARTHLEDEEEDEDLGFDYRPAEAFAAGDAADDPEGAVLEVDTAEDAAEDDEEGADEEDSGDDVDDMLAFFEKAPEVSRVPEALREGIEKVSAAQLLAEARELHALLRRQSRG